MDKIFKIVLVVLLFTSITARADTVSDLVSLGMKPELAELVASLSTVKSNAAWFKGRNQANSADISVMAVDATDDTVLNADSGDLVKISVATTPVAAIGAATPVAAFTPEAVANLSMNGRIDGVTGIALSGDAVFGAGAQAKLPVAIITPSVNMTPAAASNLSSSVNRLVSGSPTLAAVHLPAASTNIGKTFYISNEGSNPVLVFPSGTDKINAGGAATPVSVAAGKLERCIIHASDTSLCVLEN